MVYKADRLLNMKCTNSVALPEPNCNLCSGTIFQHRLPGFAFICRSVAISGLVGSYVPGTGFPSPYEFKQLYFGYVFSEFNYI